MTMWQDNRREVGGQLGTSCTFESPTSASEVSLRGDWIDAWSEPGTGSAFSYLLCNWKKQNPYRVWKSHVIAPPRYARSSPTTGFQKHNCYAVTTWEMSHRIIQYPLSLIGTKVGIAQHGTHRTTLYPLSSYNNRLFIEQYIPNHVTISIKSCSNLTQIRR